jgi:Amidohydrolase
VLARHGLGTIAGVPVPDWSPALREDFRRAWHIETSVVSISDPGIYFGDSGETRETARLVNEAGAALIAADPRRWGALASLPLPDRWVFAHGGGTLPYLAFRMSLGAFNEHVAANVPDGPPAYYERAYCDTGLCYAPSSLASLREVAPLDHIAFGSDWPFAGQLFEAAARAVVPDWAAGLAPRDGEPAPPLRALALDERLQIDRGTAGALLPRLAATVQPDQL